jgi:two-component system, LytTR family, response regulator
MEEIKKEMLRAIVIDDELPARKNLTIFLHDFCEGIQVVAEASSKEEAYQAIVTHQPDVVFLDIRMPSGAEGFDLLQQFNYPDFKVVFVTAFKDYAVQAFKANAIDYILKPVEIEELQKVVEKLKSAIRENPISSNLTDDTYQERLTNSIENITNKKITRIAISHAKGIKLVMLKDIAYLEADGNYTCIHFLDKSKFYDTRTLKIYQELLEQNNFMRIHHSYMVNLDYVVEYSHENGSLAKLSNGEEVPISRANVAAFVDELKKG